VILVSSLFLSTLNICSSHTPDVQDTVSQNISLFPRQCNQKARYINIKRNLNVIQSLMEKFRKRSFHNHNLWLRSKPIGFSAIPFCSACLRKHIVPPIDLSGFSVAEKQKFCRRP
jgi:hypothetical protein